MNILVIKHGSLGDLVLSFGAIKTLRENYVHGNIFTMGSLVESLVTGLVGRIIRRGANHVIAVTNEGIIAPTVFLIMMAILCYGLSDKIYIT